MIVAKRKPFEEIKEIVLRKTFFIVTEKKTVREVMVNTPIGAIEEIQKGNVGFFKGAGLFISFRKSTNVEDLKIDTTGSDADKLLRFYNYIISGEAQKELVYDQVEETTKPEIVSCPHCSAPFNEEIMKGQTSISCKYCGTVIKL